jgi:hypothetical protein
MVKPRGINDDHFLDTEELDGSSPFGPTISNHLEDTKIRNLSQLSQKQIFWRPEFCLSTLQVSWLFCRR